MSSCSGFSIASLKLELRCQILLRFGVFLDIRYQCDFPWRWTSREPRGKLHDLKPKSLDPSVC